MTRRCDWCNRRFDQEPQLVRVHRSDVVSEYPQTKVDLERLPACDDVYEIVGFEQEWHDQGLAVELRLREYEARGERS